MAENGQRMSQQRFASRRINPLPIELAAVEEIVPNATDILQQQGGLGLGFGLVVRPFQCAVLRYLLLWWLVEDVGACLSKLVELTAKRLDWLVNFIPKRFPVRLGNPARSPQTTSRLESIFGPRELPEEAMGEVVKRRMVREWTQGFIV